MSEKPSRWQGSGLGWLPLGGLLLLLDQITKHLIHSRLALHESFRVTAFLEILHARNPGVAFSLFDQAGGWQRWFFTALALCVSAVVLVVLRRMPGSQRLQSAGLMLIVSGALGNAIDRIRFGYVVDFVGVHWGDAWFPAFNVADSCITVGAGLVLLDAFLEWRREQQVKQGRVR